MNKIWMCLGLLFCSQTFTTAHADQKRQYLHLYKDKDGNMLMTNAVSSSGKPAESLSEFDTKVKDIPLETPEEAKITRERELKNPTPLNIPYRCRPFNKWEYRCEK